MQMARFYFLTHQLPMNECFEACPVNGPVRNRYCPVRGPISLQCKILVLQLNHKIGSDTISVHFFSCPAYSLDLEWSCPVRGPVRNHQKHANAATLLFNTSIANAE